MFNFLVGIITGSLVGWIASLIVKNTDRRVLSANIFISIVGACMAGYLVTPLFNAYPLDRSFSIAMVWVSLGGAAILLTTFEVLRTAKRFLNQKIFFSLY